MFSFQMPFHYLITSNKSNTINSITSLCLQFLKRNTTDSGPDAPIILLIPPHLHTQRTHLDSEGNTHRKTPSHCLCHYPKILALVKRKPRGQAQRGCFNLKHIILSTPHDSKAAILMLQSPSHCEKVENSQEAL